MAKKITEAVRAGRVLVSDGAWGTFLYQKGLMPGECPERWCLERFADVRDIAKSYIDASADMVGGCCGTTPAHIAAIRLAVDRMVQR